MSQGMHYVSQGMHYVSQGMLLCEPGDGIV